MGAALEIRGLTLRFGGVTALDALDLSVPAGAVLGVAGPNGSGKSSLINVLTGHYRAEGSVMLDGRPIGHLPPAERARLGIVRSFQTPRVYARLSVIDNLHAALHATRPLFQPRAARLAEDRRLRAALSIFGLARMADALPGRLTPVDLRRLELARAHVCAARVLLLDEPAAGLTRDEAETLGQVMAEHLFPGRTVLLLEHRLPMLSALAGELVVLRAGRKIAQDSPGAVLSRPDVRAFLLGEQVDA